MPYVAFTPNLQRHVDCPPSQVEGATVMQALETVFADNRRLRGYVLDDQSQLRRHVVIFVNGQTISDRLRLSDTVGPDSEIYIMQALSGG